MKVKRSFKTDHRKHNNTHFNGVCCSHTKSTDNFKASMKGIRACVTSKTETETWTKERKCNIGRRQSLIHMFVQSCVLSVM